MTVNELNVEDQRKTEVLIRKLADERWKALRKEHNQMFLSLGPGTMWEGYKARRVGEYEEIRLLQEFLGLRPE